MKTKGPYSRRARYSLNRDGMAAFLRSIAPRDTAKIIARQTGISASTVFNHMQKRTVPDGEYFIRYLIAYGLEFLAAAIPGQLPEWLKQAMRATEESRLERQLLTAAEGLVALRRAA